MKLPRASSLAPWHELAAAALGGSRDNFADLSQVQSTEKAHFNPRDEAPLISIVIPTFRRPQLLRQALHSALSQEAFDDFEVVVVDNDPDSDAPVLQQMAPAIGRRHLRYFVNVRNLGMTGNWNRCLQLAQGRWVTFLHDDDWLAPRFLCEVVPRLTAEVAAVACKISAGDSDYDPSALETGFARRAEARLLDTAAYIGGNITPAPGLLVRRALLVDLGGFDDAYYPCSDYVAYVRAAMQGRTLQLQRRLAYYRTTDSATYKDDTLVRMIRFSRAFKLALLASSPSLGSRLAYLQSMSYWFDAAARHGVEVDFGPLNALDRAAKLLGRSRTLRRALSIARQLAFPLRLWP